MIDAGVRPPDVDANAAIDIDEPADLAGDLVLEPLAPGRYRARISRRWWIVIGPNGGLSAALHVRAAVAALGRDDLVPRSLSIHYLQAPAEGDVELAVEVERAGRQAAFVSVRMSQDGRTTSLGRLVLVGPRSTELDFPYGPAPDVTRPEVLPPEPPPARVGLARLRRSHERFDRRPAFPVGGPVAGGWLRLEPPQPVDAAVVALMADNWPPSARNLLDDPAIHTITLDLTVHFRTADVAVDPEQYCLLRLEARGNTEGLHQEDAEVWSADGRLLATARQLALVFRDESGGEG